MNPRNGKIARLPKEIRRELNQRLESSEEGPQLLAWLNSLKEVKKVVQDDFAGVPVSKQNLSEWRQGGFQEWLVRRDLWDGVRDVKDFAEDLDSNRDNVLADEVATVLAARYAALISNWNGEVDKKFEAKARVLNGLTRAVVQLQRGTHRAKKENDDFIRGLEEDYEKLKEKCKKRLLDQVWAIRREPVVAEYFGGGEAGRKLAKYVVALENDVPGAELEEITEEDLKKPKRNQRKAKPVKPVEAGESEPEEASNPLEENEMEKNNKSESSPTGPAHRSRCGEGGSESVKPSQTELAQPQTENEGLGLGVGLRLGTDEG